MLVRVVYPDNVKSIYNTGTPSRLLDLYFKRVLQIKTLSTFGKMIKNKTLNEVHNYMYTVICQKYWAM